MCIGAPTAGDGRSAKELGARSRRSTTATDRLARLESKSRRSFRAGSFASRRKAGVWRCALSGLFFPLRRRSSICVHLCAGESDTVTAAYTVLSVQQNTTHGQHLPTTKFRHPPNHSTKHSASTIPKSHATSRPTLASARALPLRSPPLVLVLVLVLLSYPQTLLDRCHDRRTICRRPPRLR